MSCGVRSSLVDSLGFMTNLGKILYGTGKILCKDYTVAQMLDFYKLVHIFFIC